MIVSGVGSVYPLLRTSSLLNNLQRVMGNTPLVMFYPGKYDQLTLRLFGKLTLRLLRGRGKPRSRNTTTGPSSWSRKRGRHAHQEPLRA